MEPIQRPAGCVGVNLTEGSSVHAPNCPLRNIPPAHADQRSEVCRILQKLIDDLRSHRAYVSGPLATAGSVQ